MVAPSRTQVEAVPVDDAAVASCLAIRGQGWKLIWSGIAALSVASMPSIRKSPFPLRGRGVHCNRKLRYVVFMKLADYLYENSMTPGQLRRMLGVKNRSTIHRYLLGERVPNPETMLKIAKLTRHQVGLADFLDPSPPGCARFNKAERDRRAANPRYPEQALDAERLAPLSMGFRRGVA